MELKLLYTCNRHCFSCCGLRHASCTGHLIAVRFWCVDYVQRNSRLSSESLSVDTIRIISADDVWKWPPSKSNNRTSIPRARLPEIMQLRISYHVQRPPRAACFCPRVTLWKNVLPFLKQWILLIRLVKFIPICRYRSVPRVLLLTIIDVGNLCSLQLLTTN